MTAASRDPSDQQTRISSAEGSLARHQGCFHPAASGGGGEAVLAGLEKGLEKGTQLFFGGLGKAGMLGMVSGSSLSRLRGPAIPESLKAWIGRRQRVGRCQPPIVARQREFRESHDLGASIGSGRRETQMLRDTPGQIAT